MLLFNIISVIVIVIVTCFAEQAMGGPYKRKKYHYGDTHLKKGWRLKRKTKCLDEIDSDLAPDKAAILLNQKVDFDKPGLGQFYCVHCA